MYFTALKFKLIYFDKSIIASLRYIGNIMSLVHYGINSLKKYVSKKYLFDRKMAIWLTTTRTEDLSQTLLLTKGTDMPAQARVSCSFYFLPDGIFIYFSYLSIV